MRGRGAALTGRWTCILRLTLRPKIAAKFGGRMKAMVSGGAPLNPEVGIFFQSLGLTFLQGYGQTEAGPVISCNRPKAGIRMDTVGPPVKDTEVRIAEDGEILVRGELVMHGYWRNEANRARADDGWLQPATSAISTTQGRIVITDRKKDLIVNDKGDNVSPQRVEGMLTLQPRDRPGDGLRRPAALPRRPAGARCGMDGRWCAANRRNCDFTELADDPDSCRRSQRRSTG